MECTTKSLFGGETAGIAACDVFAIQKFGFILATLFLELLRTTRYGRSSESL